MKKDEQAFLDAKGCADRIFASDDGKFLMEFLEQMSGYSQPIPRATLEIQEGARRLVCMLKVMIKLKPDSAVKYFQQNGKNFLS